MGSLQDQLLQAGLTTSHKAKVAKSEKRKQQKNKKRGRQVTLVICKSIFNKLNLSSRKKQKSLTKFAKLALNSVSKKRALNKF
ncbi:hypothetical protein P20480_1098 [Pseudoalteromonas sp. BSi20480]|nr:hypothetical protein P20480_1098 [Pseudoalteromonas sp. BSi20480]